MVGLLTRPTPRPTTRQAPEVKGLCLHPRRLEVTQPYIDELLGTLAHELRSPLATILSAIQVITCDCQMDPIARRAVAVMDRQSRQALRIIDDLFDLCAGASGKLSLSKEVVDLAEIVAVATETAGHLFTARRHRLTVSLPPEPVYLEADALQPQALPILQIG